MKNHLKVNEPFSCTGEGFFYAQSWIEVSNLWRKIKKKVVMDKDELTVA